MSEKEDKKFSIEEFAKSYYKTYEKIYKKTKNTYSPFYANEQLKKGNVIPRRPELEDLIKWMERPDRFENELQSMSQFLEYTFLIRLLIRC